MPPYKLDICSWKVDKFTFIRSIIGWQNIIQFKMSLRRLEKPKTIRRHIAAKKLVATRIQNKWRILPEDYNRWIESGDCDEGNDRETFAIMGSNTSGVYNDVVNWIDVKEECIKDKFDGWKHKMQEMDITLLICFLELVD